jgi:hypothetical protein
MKIKLEFKTGKTMWIESDSSNYILHDGFSYDKDGNESKNNTRFYTNLKNLIEGIYVHGLLKSDATTLNELYQDLRFIHEKIKELY